MDTLAKTHRRVDWAAVGGCHGCGSRYNSGQPDLKKEIAFQAQLSMKTRAFGLIALFVVCLLSCSIMQAQSLSTNKAVVLRSEAELWSKGNLAVADELYSPDFVCHFVGGIEWTGVNGIKSAVQSHRTSFPDWHEKVEDIIAEGDRVAIRITSTGTQWGEFAGIAPTGKKITIEEFHILRLAGGQIVEQWGMPDVQGLMNQLNASSVGKKRIP